MLDISNQHKAYLKKGINLDNLLNKKLAIIGLGGLGTHLANSIIRMGFTNIVLIDGDIVSKSNISRQILYDQSNILEKKVNVSKNELLKINPNAKIKTYGEFLTSENVHYIEGCDIILDGGDNRTVREIVNRYSFENDVPWIYSSAIGHSASFAAFIPGKTPCFECLSGPDDSNVLDCNSAEGISITTLMQVTSHQINLALKILSKQNVPSDIINIDTFEFKKSEFDFSLLANPSCELCSNF